MDQLYTRPAGRHIARHAASFSGRFRLSSVTARGALRVPDHRLLLANQGAVDCDGRVDIGPCRTRHCARHCGRAWPSWLRRRAGPLTSCMSASAFRISSRRRCAPSFSRLSSGPGTGRSERCPFPPSTPRAANCSTGRPNSIVSFWCAYVLTRPLGASIADWLGEPRSLGGLGLGGGPVALALTGMIALLVGYLSLTRRDVQDASRRRAAAM